MPRSRVSVSLGVGVISPVMLRVSTGAGRRAGDEARGVCAH